MTGNVGVALVLALGSFALLYGAVKGYDPRSLFTSVFTGNPPTKLPPILGADDVTGTSVGGLTGGRPPGAAGATPAASRFVRALKAKFGSAIERTGIVANRNIAGTNTLSQHAYGNAVDIFARDLAAVWGWAIQNATRLSIRLVIYNGQQWSGGRISAYTGKSDHTSHVHVDFWPQYGGNPPGYPLNPGPGGTSGGAT